MSLTIIITITTAEILSYNENNTKICNCDEFFISVIYKKRKQMEFIAEIAMALDGLRPQPTRRTSWKLVANPGWQPRFPTSFHATSSQLFWVANKLETWQIYHDMRVGNLLHKWNAENDQACNKLPTSWQLVSN